MTFSNGSIKSVKCICSNYENRKKPCSIKLTNLLFNSLSKFEQVNLRQSSEAVEIRWLLDLHFESNVY